MNKSYKFNPNDFNSEELMQVDDLIRKMKIEIKDLNEQKVVLFNDPNRMKELNNLNESIKFKEENLLRFQQERKHMMKRAWEDIGQQVRKELV